MYSIYTLKCLISMYIRKKMHLKNKKNWGTILNSKEHNIGIKRKSNKNKTKIPERPDRVSKLEYCENFKMQLFRLIPLVFGRNDIYDAVV